MTQIKKAHNAFWGFIKKYRTVLIALLIAIVLVFGYMYVQVLEEEIPSIDWQTTIFAIVGGLGIFLYGINLMGDSLKALAGNKLKLIIEKSISKIYFA